MSDSDHPDHLLANSPFLPDAAAPEVFAVKDIRFFLKPEMDEEVSSPEGASAPPARHGVETTCGCVPVDSCACNVFEHNVGHNSCPTQSGCYTTCSCTRTCPCTATCPCTSTDCGSVCSITWGCRRTFTCVCDKICTCQWT